MDERVIAGPTPEQLVELKAELERAFNCKHEFTVDGYRYHGLLVRRCGLCELREPFVEKPGEG